MSNPPDILAQIEVYKRHHIEACKSARPYEWVAEKAGQTDPVRGFLDALRSKAKTGGLGLIAEIKKASPSKGLIREDFDPPALARAYQDGGATCLSVLTDTPSFRGADAYLDAARSACSLPVLRKDFMYERYQIAEARLLGADAVLVILAAVDDATARDLMDEAETWALDVLVEVHDETEMRRALALNAAMIGINNRDLRTFQTSLATFDELAPLARDIPVLVAESGIATSQDAQRLHQTGAHALLVGESLMRQGDVAGATRQLLG
jgi:indole-3-glycerol phosphate synthase